MTVLTDSYHQSTSGSQFPHTSCSSHPTSASLAPLTPLQRTKQASDNAFSNKTVAAQGATSPIFWREAQNALRLFPKEEQGLSTPNIKRLFGAIFTQEERIKVYKALSQGKPSELSSLLKQVQSHFGAFNNGYYLAHTIEALLLIPADQRPLAIDTILAELQKITIGYIRDDIIKVLSFIKPEQRVETLPAIVALLKGIEAPAHRSDIINQIKELPLEEQGPLLQTCSPYLCSLTHAYQRSDALQLLAMLPVHEREQTIPFCISFIEGIKFDSQRHAILKACRTISSCELKRILQLCSAFVAFHENDDTIIGYSYLHAINVLKHLQKSERRQTKAFFHLVNMKYLANIAKVLPKIPPTYRLKALQRLCRCFNISLFKYRFWTYGNIVQTIVKDEEIRKATLEYLQHKLTSTSSRVETQEFVDFVTKNRGTLGISQEHPLFQCAIYTQVKINPALAQNPHNPFTLFSNLKRIHAEEALLPLESTSMLTITLPNSTTKEISVTVCLQGFQKRATQQKFCFKDLDIFKKSPNKEHRVGPLAMEELFNAIEERQQKLSSEEQKIMQQHIDAHCLEWDNPPAPTNGQQTAESISTLNRLRAATISGSANVHSGFVREIPIMLTEEKQPDDPIEYEVYYLYVILSAIKKESKEIAPGEVLSPQEMMFLSFCNCVRDCGKGQKRGIVRFYNDLLTADQRHPAHPQAITSDEELILTPVDAEVQRLLEKLSSSESIVKTLLGIDEDGELPPLVKKELIHQTDDIKDRFHLQLGLNYNLKFDQFACCIDPTLINLIQKIDLTTTPPKGIEAHNALLKLLAAIKPNLLLTYAKRALIETIEAKKTTPEKIIKLIETKTLKKHERLNIHRYIEYETGDDLIPIYKGIKDECALTILHILGYIKINN